MTGWLLVSRRAVVEQEFSAERSALMDNLQEGSVVRGSVKNLTDYGAFVDLGGIDGLLHITDMSWGRINHPSELFEVGQEIEVKVLSYDESRQRVSLGFKQLQEDPWVKAAQKYAVGIKTRGAVVSLTDYGAFVELEDGIEGLIHISELSTDRVNKPEDVVKPGDSIKAEVISIDKDARKIGLSSKLVKLRESKADVDEYVKKATATSKSTFGDLFADQLKNMKTDKQ